MDNIFEHGGDHQYEIIKPFLKRAKGYSPDKHGDFNVFFFSLLEESLHFRAEHEELEDWVFNVKDYRLKSEVLIAISLLDSIKCLKELAKRYERGHYFFLGDLFESLLDFGVKRGWSLPALQVQFTRTVGLPTVINPLLDIISHQIYSSVDYN